MPQLLEDILMDEANTGAPAEQIIWSGSSSQVRNLHIYLLCLLVAGGVIALSYFQQQPLIAIGAAVPFLYAAWRWFVLRSRHYELTTQRVRVRQGIMSKCTDELELYRVKDVTVFEPFWQRLFGLGNIIVTTHDASTPNLTMEALPGASQTREALRNAIEDCRDRKRVRIAELE
ncbi:MAG TPA: PH domain-containing protein [Candidatus Acidoferrum sp.]|nr:PH domain-containing protein [Candidatus Acidoferrum sp.]